LIYITAAVFNAMIDAFSTHSPECGGVLGAPIGQDTYISDFYFDFAGVGTAESYTPNCDNINDMLENDWAVQNIQMVGVVHSHGNMGTYPSCGDLYYCEQIMRNAHLQQFYLPIITLNPFCLHFYLIKIDDKKIKVSKEAFEII